MECGKECTIAEPKPIELTADDVADNDKWAKVVERILKDGSAKAKAHPTGNAC